MNPQLQALLAVQHEDESIRGAEARLAALMPGWNTLNATRRRVEEEVARTEASLERDTSRLHASEERLADYRTRLERSEAVMAAATRLRDATAATTQVESARQAIAEEERELLVISRRVTDLRAASIAHAEELERITTELARVTEEIRDQKQSIEDEIDKLRARRRKAAAGVERKIMMLYDRVSSRRRSQAVFALHDDYSCGACETAIPLQRRPAMASGKCIEPCEACGVLLYYHVSVTEK